MISINRCDCPAALASSKSQTAYRIKAVVKALWRMQHQKCCYCESEIPEEGHQKAVEHFKPRAKFKEKKNDWKNLLLACPQCNGAKSDKYPTVLSKGGVGAAVVYLDTPPAKAVTVLLDPSRKKDKPEVHFTYHLDPTCNQDLLAQILPRDGSNRGEHTIDVTGIAGPFHHRQRFFYLNQVIEQAYLNLLKARKVGGAQLDVARDRFEQLMANEGQFAGLAREFARQRNLHKLGTKIPGSIAP
jgi:uncharacterized protein (TIGR02646 family)